MPNPVNSPISDPQPQMLPVIKTPKQRLVAKSDWEKLGKSRKYRQVNDYIEARKTYWQHFLPGGEAIRDMVARGEYEEAGKWAGLASIIYDELDDFQMKIQKEAR